MKRWQHRGVVQDSDDEEIGLDEETPSPQRPAKRTKLGGRSPEIKKSGPAKDAGVEPDVDEDDDQDWLQPKPPITYGRRSTISGVTGVEKLGSQPDQTHGSPHTHTNAPRSPIASQQSQSGQNDVDINETSSSRRGRSDDLPDLNEVLAQHSTVQNVQAIESHTLSVPSSPLTERDVSPSPPPLSDIFRFSTPQPAATSPATVRSAIGPDDKADDHALAASLARADSRRRNLRTRNEKQLHPYMFDKAQYQQQCRERGMRPVRVMEAAQQVIESQDASASDDDSQSSQILHNIDSSPPLQLSMNLFRSNTQQSDSEDDDVDLRAPLRRTIPDGVQEGSKRRRLFRSNSMDLRIPQPGEPDNEEAGFSVPLSPPPTSSDQNVAGQSKSVAPKFKMPRGLTPLHSLPTPQVSSDLQLSRNRDDAESSGEDLPSKRSRLPTLSRSRTQKVDVSSSSESSEPEEEPDIDDTRLHRERRRIKGVLPASWLKIDFRAQQKPKLPPESGFRYAESLSPERTSPQKGVAQRIYTKGASSPNVAHVIDISDDESEAALESRRSSPSRPRMRQPKLDFEPSRRTTVQLGFADVDDMEVDWIDPMFGGASTKSKSRSSKKRQPKIAEAFRATSGRTVDVSEERKGMRSFASTGRTSRKPTKKARKPTVQRSNAARLSILDAPAPESTSDIRQPQFVRLAARQARKRADQARHSPSHKHIRLTTKEDTEAASVVLQAWREGSIRPRQTGTSTDHMEGLSASAQQPAWQDNPTTQLRTPLADVSTNVQRRNPFELQKSSTQPRLKVINTRRPRLQQTRLHPEVIPREQDSLAPDQPATAQLRAPRPRQIRPQPCNGRYRGAQLESLETEFDQSHRAAAFEQRMQLLTESVARGGKGVNAVQLDRFLYGSGTVPPDLRAQDLDTNPPKNFEVPGAKEALPHRLRKRPAQRIDAQTREYRQPSEPLPDVVDIDKLPDEHNVQPASILQGLGSFGTRYATNFDILPLAVGTYFHESSFIGSGDFAAALNFTARDLDKITGRITIHVDGDKLQCGAWTEEVALGLARIPRGISNALESLQRDEGSSEANTSSIVLSNVDYLLRSTTRYLSRCLAFLDPVDRKPCIEHILGFVEDLFELVDDKSSTAGRCDEILTRCLQHGLVVAKQALELSHHQSVGNQLAMDCRKLVDRAAHRLAAKILPHGLSNLRSFYEDNRHASKREAGIRDGELFVASVVILYHVLYEPEVKPSQFWSVISQNLKINPMTLSSVSQFDNAWYDIFTILPLLEFDANGIAQIGTRLNGAQEDWILVRKLLERLFSLYDATVASHGSTINDYMRATLTRCHRLATRWGWWKCESVLGTVFDFFACRGLAQLKNEESRGSPRFLEDMKDIPSLDVQSDDRSFHIFLKLLASGLIGMRQHGLYTEKKIGGIAWRFIPNHGRTHRKDAEVQQQDLDALRNHHDLLCTLYYASPSKQRLRVELLRNLVDHSVSHREACRLSVRSWANLAAFQVSTDESEENLQPFVDWFREMLAATIIQFRLAKTEVERDVDAARAQGQMPAPQHVIDDTIARNQRQIAATLVDLLAAVQRTLKSTSMVQNAQYLLNGVAFWDVFTLYDPTARRLNAVLDEALSVVQTALEVSNALSAGIESQTNSDESQDYGDSAALQEFASSEPSMQNWLDSSVALLHDHVHQLLSNIFGADAISDDILLTKAVDTWALLIQRKVRSAEASWTNYLDGYDSVAWSNFRDTGQRRRFAPYFYAKVAHAGSLDLGETSMIASWLECLVEREAMLKFQHTLTSALLKQHPEEPLLWNLPFIRPSNGIFDIPLHELRQRRQALVSCILLNMRNNLESISQYDRPNLNRMRNTYADMLRRMMTAMKARYQEFSHPQSREGADIHAKGAYVDFVQHIVVCLHEYATSICQVDSFFTDNAAFPLPTWDTMYVTGKLRAYIPKLAESRSRKELASLLKTLSERAAVEFQQGYLVDQLVKAMADDVEQGDPASPSLRHVLITAIMPAYIEGALSTPCSWILAIPIIAACGRCVEKLLYQTILEDESSVNAATQTITVFLLSAMRAMAEPLTHVGLMRLPHVQAALRSILQAVQMCLTVSHHIYQVRGAADGLRRILMQFNEHTEAMETAMIKQSGFDIHGPTHGLPNLQCMWLDTLEFARKQLSDKIRQDWYTEDGRSFLRQGKEAKEVTTPLEDEAAERNKLIAAISSFRESYASIFHGCHRIETERDQLIV